VMCELHYTFNVV